MSEVFKIRDEWYAEARKQTTETLPDFIRKLTEYSHDYNTICYAVAAAALGAARAVDHSPNGGITGFQAGAIMWEFIQGWGAMEDGPKKMLCYANMLYPQYEDKFDKTISRDIWEYLQTQAKKKIADSNGHVHQEVQAHWQAISLGHVPFGYRIVED
jgi:hypothetical protein